jgi:hypothetical protein
MPMPFSCTTSTANRCAGCALCMFDGPVLPPCSTRYAPPRSGNASSIGFGGTCRPCNAPTATPPKNRPMSTFTTVRIGGSSFISSGTARRSESTSASAKRMAIVYRIGSPNHPHGAARKLKPATPRTRISVAIHARRGRGGRRQSMTIVMRGKKIVTRKRRRAATAARIVARGAARRGQGSCGGRYA